MITHPLNEMKQPLRLFCIAIVSLSCTAESIVKVHNCLPGATGICILGHVFYNNRNNATTHVFPQNQSHIRIGTEIWSRGTDSIIEEFGIDLYRSLGEPLRLEISRVEMKELVIPRELILGNFADNQLTTFSFELASTEPKLTYLDLGRNRLSNLTNITGLVNLETIHLFNNRINTLETSVFQNLTKLKYLNLNYNSIDQIVGDHLPQSLTYLGLYYNLLSSLNFTSLHLASLETLNIERNELQSLDVSAMILAMPKLNLARIGGNQLSWDSLPSLIDTLRRHNISYRDDGDEASCYYENELVEGVCMERPKPDGKPGWIKATLLSLLTIVLAIVFVLVARWVFLAINK